MNDQVIQLGNLLNDHEIIIRNLRQKIGLFANEYKDACNAGYLTCLMEEHKKRPGSYISI